jgi:two-component system, chemotaxis family, CheB/CheR fusion protein
MRDPFGNMGRCGFGLRAVKKEGGLVIEQYPEEAGNDGMPRCAIMTGAMNLVLPAAKIPEALVKCDRRMAHTQNELPWWDTAQDWLPEIIDRLRAKTIYNLRLYKPATLQPRIERRMAMAAIEADDMDR